MNIYTKIEQIDNFTESEKIFIDYIIQNPQKIMNFNLKEIAKKSYVSISTAYRVLEKLGINGINDLKLQISSQFDDYVKELQDVDYNYPFHKNNTHYQIMNKICSLYNQSLKSTLNLIDLDTFFKVIQALYHAHQIIVFPSVKYEPIVKIFQQNMLEIGVKIEIVNQSYYQYWLSQTFQKDDVVMIISYNNNTPLLLDAVKELKSMSIQTILISAAYEKKLSQLTDYHLYFPSYENVQEKIAPFSSQLSLHYLLDCIYSCYFSIAYEKHLHYKFKHY